ncbi:hypothetical protein GCM10009527_096460 [Actinomadura nitritigenes]
MIALQAIASTSRCPEGRHQAPPGGMSGGRPAVSHRSVVPLGTLCDTYGLADEAIGDPAGAAESGTPA